MSNFLFRGAASLVALTTVSGTALADTTSAGVTVGTISHGTNFGVSQLFGNTTGSSAYIHNQGSTIGSYFHSVQTSGANGEMYVTNDKKIVGSDFGTVAIGGKGAVASLNVGGKIIGSDVATKDFVGAGGQATVNLTGGLTRSTDQTLLKVGKDGSASFNAGPTKNSTAKIVELGGNGSNLSVDMDPISGSSVSITQGATPSYKLGYAPQTYSLK